jgi:lysine-N-methylase
MKRMLTATADDLAERARVVRLVFLDHEQSMVVLNEQGACPMLEKSGQCELHRKYGDAALATPCAVFPRTSLQVGDTLEVTGTLACPELATLTLLSEDGVTQRESPTLLLPRNYVGKSIQAVDESSDAYVAHFEVVRATLSKLFALRDFPLSSRLTFAAQFAAQVEDFFFQDTAAFQGKQRRFAHQRLVAEIGLAEDTETLSGLHDDMQAFAGNNQAVLSTVLSLLRQRLRLAHPTKFAAAVAGLVSTKDADVKTLSGLLTEHNVGLAEKFPGLLDRILSRYAQHCLLRSPYTEAPNLLVYLGRLALDLATVRTLVLASTALEDLLAEPANPKDDANALGQTVVDMVQIFTKTVSHHAAFLRAFHQGFESGKGTTFGRLVLFARYFSQARTEGTDFSQARTEGTDFSQARTEGTYPKKPNKARTQSPQSPDRARSPDRGYSAEPGPRVLTSVG